jgi:predicted dehydrogenase
MKVATQPRMGKSKASSISSGGKIRYGVVGLGHIAQVAILPAFAHAGENSELRAIFSSDPEKLEKVGKRHDVPVRASYDDFDEVCSSGEIDAVFIALPNDLHRDFTERAARAGVHVLCEKPMASSASDCEAMMKACSTAGVKLMIAYRLHFERASLEAIRIAQSGKLGEVRFFTSEFSQDVRAGDVRLQKEKGGGTLWDIGIYCLNAARHIFAGEPHVVSATVAARQDERFAEVEEMAAATLHFPGDRIATFVCSFGAADVASYRIVGTGGDLRVEPAYPYATGLAHELTIGETKKRRRFPHRDQFAPEILYFSKCILEDREPEPSGLEGLIDVRIIEALYESARSGRPVRLDLPEKKDRPSMKLHIDRPPVRNPPQPVKTKSPAK